MGICPRDTSQTHTFIMLHTLHIHLREMFALIIMEKNLAVPTAHLNSTLMGHRLFA
jgi:hypothetical protein